MVDWSTRPHASSAIETLGAWPNLVAAVDKLAEEHGDSYADSVERHVARLGEAGTPDGDAAIEAATDGYIEMTIETLRLQAEFYRTGKFPRTHPSSRPRFTTIPSSCSSDICPGSTSHRCFGQITS